MEFTLTDITGCYQEGSHSKANARFACDADAARFGEAERRREQDDGNIRRFA